MRIDKLIHDLYDYKIPWRDFSDVGLDEPYYNYYYAEDRLYIIKDNMSSCMWFVEATSPAEALKIIKDRWEELCEAGQFVEEETW